MTWELKIRKVDNGFILEHDEEMTTEEDKVEYEKVERIIQSKEVDEDDKDLECAKEMLEEVLEYFAYNYSKHNKRNIKIEIEEVKE